jgi:hypothetical protein
MKIEVAAYQNIRRIQICLVLGTYVWLKWQTPIKEVDEVFSCIAVVQETGSIS